MFLATDQRSWQNYMKIVTQMEHCTLHSDDTTRMCLCMSEILVYPKFWEFIHYSASNLENTHTQTQCFVFYRIIVFAWTLLCIGIWQHDRKVHMQYNSKPGLHAQHRCIVIPVSLYRVQDVWTSSSYTTLAHGHLAIDSIVSPLLPTRYTYSYVNIVIYSFKRLHSSALQFTSVFSWSIKHSPLATVKR